MIFIAIWLLVTRPYLGRVTLPYLRRVTHRAHHRLTYGGALMMPTGCVPKPASSIIDRLRLERTLTRLATANEAWQSARAYVPQPFLIDPPDIARFTLAA